MKTKRRIGQLDTEYRGLRLPPPLLACFRSPFANNHIALLSLLLACLACIVEDQFNK